MHWVAVAAVVCLMVALTTLVSWLSAGRPTAASGAVERVVFGKRKRDKKTHRSRSDGSADEKLAASSPGVRYGIVPDERSEVAVVRRASLMPREEGEVAFMPDAERQKGVWSASVVVDGAVEVVRPDGGSAGTYSFGRRWRAAAVSSDSRLLAAVAEGEPSRAYLYRRDVLNDDAFEPWTSVESDLPVERLCFAVESFLLLTAHAGGAVRAYRMPERTKGAAPKLAFSDGGKGRASPPVRGMVREEGRLVLLS
jgi:hypothetical protein